MRVEQIGDATLILGDAREVLPTLGAVDAVVTDPPYGMGRFDVAYTGGTRSWAGGREARSWDFVPDSVFHDVAAHAIIWGGNFFSLPPSRGWLVWDKQWRDMTYAAAELAWTNIPMGTQVFSYSARGPWPEWAHGSEKHPTQKPIALMEWCLGFVPNAHTILDPFCGSGSTGVACARLGRSFIGIEIEPRYFDIACRRIEAEYRQPRMFTEPAPKAKQEALL
jgi:site-specific DNA-methyltransferase (adenine-specific)